MGLGSRVGPGGGLAEPGSAACVSLPGNQWAGGRGRPGKGREGKATGGSSRLGSAQPSPAHPAGAPAGRSAAALLAGGQPEGVGPPGGAGRRPQHAAEGPSPAAAATPWAGGTGPLPARCHRSAPAASVIGAVFPPAPACRSLLLLPVRALGVASLRPGAGGRAAASPSPRVPRWERRCSPPGAALFPARGGGGSPRGLPPPARRVRVRFVSPSPARSAESPPAALPWARSRRWALPVADLPPDGLEGAGAGSGPER